MVHMYFDLADVFAAKSGKDGEWLSVREHLLDTMGVMEKLLAYTWRIHKIQEYIRMCYTTGARYYDK